MDSRKRQRLEVTSNATIPVSNVASATTQSFFLSTNPNDCGVTANNVLLTICTDEDDDNVHSDDESHEFLTINESLAIKQEDSTTTATLPIHYRIVNPTSITTVSESTQTPRTSTVAGAAATTAMLPASVQLPSGCDIYLVKEYVDASSGAVGIGSCVPSGTTIKLESNERIASAAGSAALQIVRSVPCLMPKNIHSSVSTTATTSIATAAGSAALAGGGTDTVPLNKRSYILETYKKRDDKRRATHNEVERRRRDKINSWIFKLKEMLPEMPTSNNNSTSTNVCNNKSFSTTTERSNTVVSNNNNNGNCRTPPSDSKSQILIKACEYIKTMQEEIKSLRECLTENENLRLSNQSLQCELETLKNERQNRNANDSNSNNNNNSYNITLNNLNNNGLFSTTTPTGTGVYTKRELIIRDYVD